MNRMQSTTGTLLAALGVVLAACSTNPGPGSAVSVTPALTAATQAVRAATSTSVPLPPLTLKPGSPYFSLDGQPGFVFSRNVAGYQKAQYDTFLDWSRDGGTRFVRLQLDSLGMGYTRDGAVDSSWAWQWEQVFDKAQADGLYILPVFSGWFDWNTGPGYSTWKSNPLNQANGGPVQTPAELFQKGSPTQTLWLQWMQTLVERWRDRKNILAWEIFSEVNLASGVTETSGVDFVNSAAAVIKSADPSGRPITASLAETGTWPRFYKDADVDFINVHPYPPSAQLDRDILSKVRAALTAYKRPVLIGESGLNAESPEKYPPNAEVGVRHAIWAAVVSGAMNGRSLYWEDSFAIYFPNLGLPFMQKYASLELPAERFVAGMDFSGFRPLASGSSSGVWGASIGNEKSVIAWFRDAACEPPDWNLKSVISGQKVIISVPGPAQAWKVDFYDTTTGTTVLSSSVVMQRGGKVTIALPDFTDEIALKLYAQE
jgi:hypothetical protein